MLGGSIWGYHTQCPQWWFSWSRVSIVGPKFLTLYNSNTQLRFSPVSRSTSIFSFVDLCSGSWVFWREHSLAQGMPIQWSGIAHNLLHAEEWCHQARITRSCNWSSWPQFSWFRYLEKLNDRSHVFGENELSKGSRLRFNKTQGSNEVDPRNRKKRL